MTTVGRVLFNNIIPQDLGYVDRTKEENICELEINKPVKKGELKALVADVYDKYMLNIPQDFNKILQADKETFIEYVKNITNYELNLMAQTCTCKEYIKEVDDELLNSKKIFLHYECNNCFMSKNQIINNADRIKNIPINIYHSRLDLLCPLSNVYDLCKKLNNVELTIIPYENHCGPLLKQLSYKEVNNYIRG